MKKAKLVGVLLAAVIASAPITGYAGSILPFKDNAIVAEAASAQNYIMVTGKNVVYRPSYSPIMKCGIYNLYLRLDGNLVISISYGSYPVWQSNTAFGSKYNSYSVAFQEDGNLVVYANGYIPIFHTNSYYTNKLTKYGYTYEYYMNGKGIWLRGINPNRSIFVNRCIIP